jgi:hypothetical protein
MRNPWMKIDLDIYENHMADAAVMQSQALNLISGEQIGAYKPACIAYLGVAGGNGLEHCSGVDKVYAVDINPDFIAACAERYRNPVTNGSVPI